MRDHYVSIYFLKHCLYLMAHKEKTVWFFRNTDTCSCGYALFLQFFFFNFRMCIRLKQQVYIFHHFFKRNHYLGLIKRKETPKASGICLRFQLSVIFVRSSPVMLSETPSHYTMTKVLPGQQPVQKSQTHIALQVHRTPYTIYIELMIS